MTRPISDAWFHRLKSATRDLVRACGGVERAGEIALVSKSEISRWQTATDPGIITLPAALALEAECGVPFVTAVMADLNGRRLTDDEAARTSAACLISSHAEILRRVGEVTTAMAAALADGSVTPAESEIVDRAASELERGLYQFRQGLAANKSGSSQAPPLRAV